MEKWRLREDHAVEVLQPGYETIAEGGWRNKVRMCRHVQTCALLQGRPLYTHSRLQPSCWSTSAEDESSCGSLSCCKG